MFGEEQFKAAMANRDARFDGVFFVSVRTTHIYCRPVCRVRMPRFENVEFYPSAAAAEHAGYRACLRCRPEAAPFSPAWNGTKTTVERAMRLSLLAVALFINFLDRGSLATAGPLLAREMNLTNTSFGILIAAFFVTYVPGQLVAGWLAHRFDTAVVLAVGVAIWASATILSGVAGGFAMLFVLRLFLGLGESIAIPCTSKMVAECVPQSEIGKANGLISVGLALGPGVGVLLGGLLMARYGWRITFIAFGLASSLWLIPWLIRPKELQIRPGHSIVKPPSYFEIMRKREAWGADLGHFSFNYVTYFLLAWLPIYLVTEYSLSMDQLAVFGGLGTLLTAASALFFGWCSDRWIAAGRTVSGVRLSMMCVGLLISAACMMMCTLGNPMLAIAGLVIAASFHGLMSCNVYSIAQTLSGPAAAGKWTGFQNCIGNFAGILAPIVTGLIVDRTGSFLWAFATAAGVSLLGVIAYGVFVRQIGLLKWKNAAAT